ncbi:MAG: hypothetical protein RIA71_14125 [Oceanicaulis sp.]
MMVDVKFALTGLAALMAAACSGEPQEGSAEHLLYGVEGGEALPGEALAALGAAALPYWTRCGEQLVTRDSGRDGEGESRFVAASPLRLQLDAAGPPPSDAGAEWRGLVRLSSGRHRTASADGPWSNWVGLTALDLPVWTLHAEDGAWRASLRPQADPEDAGRYDRQYGAPACAALPADSAEPAGGA